MIKIAVLLTCHNRKNKTLLCFQSLFESLDIYNNKKDNNISIEIFLTDDGCTDGTADAVRIICPENIDIHVLQGNGKLYWAGGMRLCWHEALRHHGKWDYYLLLNDDTILMPNVFFELFNAYNYSLNKLGKEGIVSGITCATDDLTKLTYGGDVIINHLLGTFRRLKPNGEPQQCDKTNANILLVPKSVVDKVGIFHDGFIHGHADTDYSVMVKRKGLPVLLTANFCGRCDNDHESKQELAKKILNMTLRERKAYFSHPLHSTSDYLLAIKRVAPLRLPIVWLGRMLNLYFPKLYYRINGIRS